MKKFYFIALLITIFSCQKEPKNTKVSGPVFGTSYNIQFYSEDGKNYQKQFDSLFNVVNKSLSTYIPDSDISRINKNEDVEVDEHFKRVFKKSKEVYRYTEGAFDPTIGNVVNAWNFGADTTMTLHDQPDFETNTHIAFAPNGGSKSAGAPCKIVPKSKIVNKKHMSVVFVTTDSCKNTIEFNTH